MTSVSCTYAKSPSKGPPGSESAVRIVEDIATPLVCFDQVPVMQRTI